MLPCSIIHVPGVRGKRVREKKIQVRIPIRKATTVELGLKRELWGGDKFPPDWNLWVPMERAFILLKLARGT